MNGAGKIYRGFDLAPQPNGDWLVTKEGQFVARGTSEDDAMSAIDTLKRRQAKMAADAAEK